MSTINDLFKAVITESGYRHRRYWKSSRLPVRERIKNKPVDPKYPRDKVLMKLMRLEMNVLLNNFKSFGELYRSLN